jgi:hypothetical protein
METRTDKYVLSYGGGVNSSALYFYIVHIKKLPLELVIFANTGEESQETIDTVNNMRLQCAKDNIEFIEVQSKYGRLVDYYTKNKGIPSLVRRDCTSKFKISPIRQHYRLYIKRFADKLKNIKLKQYIGIAWDEASRMTTSDVAYIDYLYPFCEDKITRKGNVEILEQFNFKASKSGCTGCFFQSKANWIKLYKENNTEFMRWKKMEEENRHYSRDKNPLYLNGKFSLKQIEDMILNQNNLNKWTKDNDEDLTCKNLHGGCFL